jgi:hypothetical protein
MICAALLDMEDVRKRRCCHPMLFSDFAFRFCRAASLIRMACENRRRRYLLVRI